MPITSVTFGGNTFQVVGSIQLINPERIMPEPKPKVAIRIPSVLDFLHPLPGHVHECDKPKRRATSSPMPSPGPAVPTQDPREIQPVPQQLRETGIVITDRENETPELEVRNGTSYDFQRMHTLLARGWRRIRPMTFPLGATVRPRQWHWARPMNQPQSARNFRGINIAFAQLVSNESRIPPPPTVEQVVAILDGRGWHRFPSGPHTVGRTRTLDEWEWTTNAFEDSPPVHYLSTREAYHGYLLGVDVPYSLTDATEPTVQVRHALIPTPDVIYQHEALAENGWQRVTPPGHLEGVPVQVMSYYWRRPGVGGRSRGRLYRSTNQAYNQLRRDNEPQLVPIPERYQPPVSPPDNGGMEGD